MKKLLTLTLIAAVVIMLSIVPILMQGEITATNANIAVGLDIVRSHVTSITIRPLSTTISSWPDGVMTLVADQLPLPNEVSVGITEISPIMVVSAVAVSVVFAMFAIFNGPGPPGILSAGVTHKLNWNCSLVCARSGNPLQYSDPADGLITLIAT